jgi:hypothetical protein
MTINHYIPPNGINFIKVGFYPNSKKISHYGYFKKPIIKKGEHTIGIWKIKYKKIRYNENN